MNRTARNRMFVMLALLVALVSFGPPAAKGTIMCIGFAGYVCANALKLLKVAASRNRPTAFGRTGFMFPPHCEWRVLKQEQFHA